MSEHALDVGLADFQQHVLEESKQRPVVVDFWAPWCGPCKSLKPILEKLAVEYGGKFLLAKINSDDNQELAARYAVRGIPSVKAFIDGEPVDEFSGALPEGEVRAFLDRLIPGPAEELRAQAAELHLAGDATAALQRLADASRIAPAHVGVRLDAAEIMLDLGEADEARRLLASVPDDADPRAPQLKARLQFVGTADEDEAALNARVAADEKRSGGAAEARLTCMWRPAGSNLAWRSCWKSFAVTAASRTTSAAKTLLSVFTLLGGGELVSRYRRLLASALN